MRTDTLAVFALVSVLAIAGCTGAGGPGTPVPEGSPTPNWTGSPSPTGSPIPTTSPTPTPSPTPNTGFCERPTPDPVPDLSLINRLDESRSVSVTITPADGTSPVYEESLTLEADEDVDRYEVVPGTDSYRITASLPVNTSATGVMEIEPGNRYSIVTVIVREDRVFVERLNVHPEPTPTPCSEPTSTRTEPTPGTEQPTPRPSGIDADATSGVASPASP